MPSYDVRAGSDRKRVEVCCAMPWSSRPPEKTGPTRVLTLSAAQPAIQVRPPLPAPWLLTADSVAGTPAAIGEHQAMLANGLMEGDAAQSRQEWNPGVNLQDQMLKRVVSNRAAHQMLLGNSNKVQAVSAALESRRTSTSFALSARVSIRSDGKPQRVLLASASAEMTTSCRVVPRSSLNAYVVGSVPNNSGLPWLPGDAQVFVGGDLVGSTSLDFVAPRELAEMYFGIDESIKVERELDSRTSGRLLFSSRIRIELAYAITLENLRLVPAKIVLHEALPVSQDERIKARVLSLSPRCDEQERGVARWTLTLVPGERKTIDVAYAIEYPDGIQLPQIEKLRSRLITK